MKFIITLFFTLIFLLLACEQQFSPLQQNEFTLKTEYVGVTDAELQLHVKNRPENTAFRLLRNDSIVLNGQLTTDDTLLYDHSLKPNQNYRYQAILLKDGKKIMQSNSMTVNTMDTTSHEVQWEIFEFPSPYGSGELYDVNIIDRNDIWVVGEIHADSAKPWMPYNAVHWDGEKWELKRIPFIGACSAVDYPQIRAIWAFSENNILFTNGGAIARYNGSSTYLDCGMNAFLDGAIRKIFATESSNVYAVGGAGTIVHYDGQRWQKLESSTDTRINDIWGAHRDNHTTILAAVSDRFSPGYEIRLLSISADGVKDTLQKSLNRKIHSVWFNEKSPIYVSGDGLRVYKNGIWNQIDIPSFFSTRIRGTKINNIFVVGAFGLMEHFNGLTWHHYPELMKANGTLEGLAVFEDMVVAVGEFNNTCFVYKGENIKR